MYTGNDTRAARRARKSKGSKMTAVVPSRYGVFSRTPFQSFVANTE
jgi:hypothetical protein